MPLWIVESFFALLLLGSLVWIGSRSFTRNIHFLKYQLLKLIACYIPTLLLWKIADSQNVQLTTMIKAGLFVGLITWCAMGLILRPAKKTVKTGSKRISRMGNASLLTVTLLAWFIGMDVIAKTIPRSYLVQKDQHSWLFNSLANHHGKADESTPPSLEDVMAQQNMLFTGLRNQADSARQWLYDATGINTVVQQLGALQQILALSHAQRTQIIQTNPQLLALTQHPRLLKIVNNSELVDLITQAGEGHMQALWQLHQHPDLTALMNDRQLHKQMMQLDIHRIIQTYQQRQWVDQSILPVTWYTTTLTNPKVLADTLENPASWQRSAAGMQWEPSSTWTAAWAEVHAQVNQRLELHIQTQANVTVYIDQQQVATQSHPDGYMLQLTSTGKPMAVCILLDFRHTQQSRTCQINLTAMINVP